MSQHSIRVLFASLSLLAVTAAVVVLLARFETQPPRTVNPNSALDPVKTPHRDDGSDQATVQ